MKERGVKRKIASERFKRKSAFVKKKNVLSV